MSNGHNSSLILAVNRLSGDLPDFSAKSFYSLDILNGNIFGCKNSASYDENSNTYICGSQPLNQSLIPLCGLLSVFAVILIYYYIYCYRTNKSLQHEAQRNGINAVVDNLTLIYKYFKVACDLDISIHPNLVSLINCLSRLTYNIWVMCIFGILFTSPLYILKGLDYGKANPSYATHSVLYMWEMTTAYITGVLPAVLLLLAWFVSVCLFVALITTITTGSKQSNLYTGNNSPDTNKLLHSAAAYSKFGFMLLLNICVVGMMNGFYVYLTLLEFDVRIHTSIQICFAFVKYIWNFIVVPWAVISTLPISPYRSWLELFVNMLNSVFIPCIASSFTSTSCFQVCIDMYFALYV
jgi:hypothetical protein